MPTSKSYLVANGVAQVTLPAISGVQMPTLRAATVVGLKPGLRGKSNIGGNLIYNAVYGSG